MPDNASGSTPESDYELALRLAGLSSEGGKLVDKKAAVAKAVNARRKKADVRVNTLNKPNSILKKWHKTAPNKSL